MRQDKKIWVADDDESIRWVLEKGLTEAGFNVSTFEDGNEVMNKLDVESPNIVLTDMRMPGRDGMDLLDTFKNEYPDIPIIMMTAFSDLETTVEAFDHGAKMNSCFERNFILSSSSFHSLHRIIR